jgi:hypothetical protein
VLGRLPPFPVDVPWWPDVAPIVDGARASHGVDVVVLRMLHADRPQPHGGTVTYLAEVAGPVPRLEPWPGELDDHPLRAAWARPGGPAADLAWAARSLHDAGRTPSGPAEQIRTWNLSSLWRLPVDGSWVWLKHVPPFFAHEATIIRRLGVPWIPRLIASDGGRSLMEEIPGEDQYDAGADELAPAVSRLIELQRTWAPRVDELLALGLPDWRGPALTAAIAELVEREGRQLEDADRRSLDELLAGLPERLERIAACGIPDSLVHGDFAGGNLRGIGDQLVLLDWGDSCVGHPLLDQAAMLDRAPADAVEPLRRRWVDAWAIAAPGSDPITAARLLAPVVAARPAVIYQRFLDGIEPSEWPYHRSDVPLWLRQAAALARAER